MVKPIERDIPNFGAESPSLASTYSEDIIADAQGSHALLHHTRLLVARDAIAITKHLLELPDYDRYLRFCGVVSDTAIERLIAQRVVDREHAFIGYGIGGLLIGVAQLARPEPSTFDWELAISVDPGYRRLGVASRLVLEATSFTSNKNSSLYISTLSENKPMISLAKKSGFKLHLTNQSVSGQLQVVDKVAVPVPDPEFGLHQR
ncbi:MAG: GNAT family N-acetyltransferase [Pseudomonadota bacterium]